MMAVYLYRGLYSADVWAKLVANPQDISELMKPSIERFGGKVIACFLTVAETEPGGFIEFPDDTSAAAWGIYLKSQGLMREITLVPMMTTQEGMRAMKLVGGGGTNGGSGVW